MKKTILLILLVIAGCTTTAPMKYPQTVNGALNAERNGDHQQAINIFSGFADAGDSKAMIHIGLKYYNGSGVPRDYEKSMDWFLRALEANNPDSLNNIGVQFRDGKGVEKNRKIAYLLFLYTHMEYLGGASTQQRANSNLRREVAEQSKDNIQEALCYTNSYLFDYIKSKGYIQQPSPSHLPSESNPSFKNVSWWSKDEAKNMNFKCPKPWGKA